MKRLQCSLKKKGYLYNGAAVCLMVFFLTALPVAAEEPNRESGDAKEMDRIHITADSMLTSTNDNLVEFIGNVRATQGTSEITCDRLKVFYRQQAESQAQAGTGTDAIGRIIAQGNVKIIFGNQVATTQHADYVADKRIVILTGKDTQIARGNNSISGSKITLYRDDGRIQVEGSKEKRVEAFFYSKEGELGIAPE